MKVAAEMFLEQKDIWTKERLQAIQRSNNQKKQELTAEFQQVLASDEWRHAYQSQSTRTHCLSKGARHYHRGKLHSGSIIWRAAGVSLAEGGDRYGYCYCVDRQ
jgi:hypothetical protein